jgi:predicted amidohydrolase YtcJ
LLDARGQLLLPGFNDAHVHFASGGAQLDAVELNDATSAQELVRRLAERAAKTPQGTWIRGGDWDETKWTPAELPTKELIDPVTPDTPVFLSRYDGHMALANSLALRLAGINSQTPDPVGGVIVRDAHGNPTGALKDAALNLLAAVVPPISRDERKRAIRRALAHAASLGVTSVQDMDGGGGGKFEDISVYGELLETGELTARVYVAPLITNVDAVAHLGIRHAFGGPYLRIGALKSFADGSLGSRTAYFFAPYLDSPRGSDSGNRGLLGDEMQPLAAMLGRMTAADAAGLQLCTHAIGDQAISIVLDLYQQIQAAHGERDRRFRIEHAQHMAAKDFDRFRESGGTGPAAPMLSAPSSTTGCIWHLAPTGRLLRSTPSWGFLQRSPAPRSMARTRTAGFPSRSSRLRKQSKPTPWVPPLPNTKKGKKAQSPPGSWRTWSCSTRIFSPSHRKKFATPGSC